MLYSALIGNPVEHSCSPALFAYLGEKAGVEYAHIKILIEDPNSLKNKIKELKSLGFCGINVTCPYKVDCVELVDEIDEDCKKMRSVNTIQTSGEKLKGFNTDGIAAIEALETQTKINPDDKVVVFGAGGVARSVIYEISKFTKNITIFNIDIDQAKNLVADIDPSFEYYDLSNREIIKKFVEDATIVANCTSVGMAPNGEECILSEQEICETSKRKKIYFDVVFNPWDTKFVEYAQKNDNIAISGGVMLIRQAMLAIEVWTGIKVELEDSDMIKLKEILINEINKHKN